MSIIQSSELEVGRRVRLDGARKTWRVQALSENFAACVQQADFEPKGTLCYTILDWRNGVRGPCNLIGQGYGDGTYSEAQCAEMLARFEYDDAGEPARLAALAAGETTWSPEDWSLSVSHRNRVRMQSVEAVA